MEPEEELIRLRAENQALREQLAQRDKELAQRDRLLEQREKLLARRDEQIAQLPRRAQRWKKRLDKSSRNSFLNSAMTLAVWRWRQQWFLLFVMGIGAITAVALICALPLFSGVMTTAGVRGALRAQPNSAQIVAKTEVVPQRFPQCRRR